MFLSVEVPLEDGVEQQREHERQDDRYEERGEQATGGAAVDAQAAARETGSAERRAGGTRSGILCAAWPERLLREGITAPRLDDLGNQRFAGSWGGLALVPAWRLLAVVHAITSSCTWPVVRSGPTNCFRSQARAVPVWDRQTYPRTRCRLRE